MGRVPVELDLQSDTIKYLKLLSKTAGVSLEDTINVIVAKYAIELGLISEKKIKKKNKK